MSSCQLLNKGFCAEFSPSCFPDLFWPVNTRSGSVVVSDQKLRDFSVVQQLSIGVLEIGNRLCRYQVSKNVVLEVYRMRSED